MQATQLPVVFILKATTVFEFTHILACGRARSVCAFTVLANRR